MSFAIASADPQHPAPAETAGIKIDQLWWPAIDLDRARSVMRLNGTVTDERLRESLFNAAYSVNDDLAEWSAGRRELDSEKLTDERLVNLYMRAVFFYAKAELVERYRDFDTTGAGDKRADSQEDVADESRRNMRWAISDILGVSRVTIEAM